MSDRLKLAESLIGDTPLVEIPIRISHARIWAKVETFNLTGSVKDRMALYMLKQAEARGDIKRGSVIIEATTGNTGIALAALAAIRGYKMLAVMPERHSAERKKMIELYGGKVIETPHDKGPPGAIELRDKLAREIPNAWVPDQFANGDNVRAHQEGLGLEIVKQLRFTPNYFVHGVGTGGTLMGVAKVLKGYFPQIKIVAVESDKAAVLSRLYGCQGGHGGYAGAHGIQGIGEGFVPSLVDRGLIDEIVTVSTREAKEATVRLATKFGLFVGFSSGANLAAIRKLARSRRTTDNYLTIFADRGERYLSALQR